MNDFTKEELENMINWGEVYTEFGNSWTDKMQRPLIAKLQSLIDNYCEHEPSDAINSQFIWQLCHKCGAQLEISESMENFYPNFNWHNKLRTKIQSMIDNYCDHTFTDGIGSMILCNKCQAYGGKR